MSYTPTTWVTGDIVTAEKLNKLENGVSASGDGGVFLVDVIDNDGDPSGLNASYNELSSALEQGKLIFAIFKGVTSDPELPYYYIYLVTSLEEDYDFNTQTIYYSCGLTMFNIGAGQSTFGCLSYDADDPMIIPD